LETQTQRKPQHSVLVLTYKKADLIEARIAELTHFFSHRSDVEFVIFDNGSTDPAVKLVVGEASLRYRSDRRWKFGSAGANLGFGGGWNAAVEIAQGDKLYLLSDDVEVLGDFMPTILERSSGLPPGVLVGQSLVHGPAGWNEFGESPPISYLNGHFLAMDHMTFLRLQGFDDATFHPYDYEDMDLCYRAAQEHGWSLLAIPELPLRHTVAGTIGYNPERFDHTVKMRARFAAKHDLVNEPERP
jgi:GT2 family glycosyltransferase